MQTDEIAKLLARRAEARADFYWFSRYGFLKSRGRMWMRNWHHEVICRKLEDVFNGKVRRLIINIPPRYSKTELAVVNWIAWCLGMAPDSEFIHVSYAAKLAINNAFRIREMVKSDWYGELFPATMIQSGSEAKDDWRTTAGGVVYSTGAEGTITGFGAGKMRPKEHGFGGCFPYDQMVETERGPMRIGDIVNTVEPLRVWSFNETTKCPELRSVVRRWHNPGNHIIEVSSSDGRSFRCTPDHEVLTRGGWVSAVHLAKALDLVDGQPGKLGGALAAEAPIEGDLHDAFRVLWLCVPLGIRKTLRNGCPRLAELDLPDDADADAISASQLGRAFRALENGRDVIARELGTGAAFEDREGSVAERVLHIVGLCAVGEIGHRVVRGVPIEVPDLVSNGAWAYELLRDHVRDVAHGHEAIDGQVDPSISLPVVRRLNRTQGLCPSDLAEVRHLVQPTGAADWTPDSIRYVGHVDETFCLEVEGNHNFILSQSEAVVSNCIVIDDPHKADEATSDTMRQNVIDWFQNTLESRVNSPETPIVLIMQRLHENDLAGWLLGGGNGEKWHHLCIPAIEDDEPLWPEKHTIEELRRMERSKPYEFAGQYMQRPAPLGGGIFKTAWWRYYRPGALPTFRRIVHSWDTAFKTKAENDYSVRTIWGEAENGYYLLDLWKEKVEFPVLKRMVESYKPEHQPHAILVEDKASGQSLIQEIRSGSRLPIVPIKVDKDKVARAFAVTPLIEAGRVFLPEGAPWLADYIGSLASFPNAVHDDDVDSTTQALTYLDRGGGNIVTARQLRI